MTKRLAVRKEVDLAAHVNKTVLIGNPAEFPVGLVPVYAMRQDASGVYEEIPGRKGVARLDTGKVLSVVSNRYTLKTHSEILDTVTHAIAKLDVGEVPHGIFVDRGGARMRALFKFPALSDEIGVGDELCPCIKIQNTYDGTSRIGVHVGSYQFVCTNLAVGGGGAFAEGFMSVHIGDIKIEVVAERLQGYLTHFGDIMNTYRGWKELTLSKEDAPAIPEMLKNMDLPKKLVAHEAAMVAKGKVRNVFDAYSVATDFATHRTRSSTAAFRTLEKVNRGWQELWGAEGV